jgi:hypothetical protein
MFLPPRLGQTLGFIADDTGRYMALVQMFGLWFWGGCRGILPKHKTLAVRGLQYVFTAKAGVDFGV